MARGPFPLAPVLLISVVSRCLAADPGTFQFFWDRISSGEIALPPAAYYLTTMNATTSTFSAQYQLLRLEGVHQTTCNHQCLHRPDCWGAAWRQADASCLLASSRPTPDTLESTGDDWVLFDRRGASLLDGTCDTSADCRLVVPRSVCTGGVCACGEGFNRTASGACAPAGGRLVGSDHQPRRDALLSEAATSDLAACRQSCHQQPLCLALQHDAAAGTCRLFSDGVTDGAPPDNGWQTELVVLPSPPPCPYLGYTGVADRWYKAYPPSGYEPAVEQCASDGAIVWPGRNVDGRREALAAAGLFDPNSFPYIGLEDTRREGQFIFSDGLPFDGTVAWSPGEPNNAGGSEDCAHVIQDGSLNDGVCDWILPFICEYMGRNVAMGQPTWSSFEAGFGDGPSSLTDGNWTTKTERWWPVKKHLLVRLDGEHQVTGLVLGTKAPARNLEVWVGRRRDRYDRDAAVLCVRLPGLVLARRTSRYFACDSPVQGSVVHLVTPPEDSVAWREVAVFGTPLPGF